MEISYLKQALVLLHHLKPEELTQLEHGIKALRSLNGGGIAKQSGKTNGSEPSERDWLLDTVFAVGQELGIECYYKQLLVEAKRPGVSEKLENIKTWLAKAGPDKTTRVSLLRVGLPLLYADLGWMDVAVTGATILRYIHRLPAVFDRHFPGYFHAGMLSMVVDVNHRRV